MSLDRIDHRILEELQNNSRISNKELAAKINLAPSSCFSRLKKLNESGIIEGHYTQLNPKACGVELEAMIAVRLQHKEGESFSSFRNHLMGLPEILNIFHTAGREDFLVHVAVRDSEHLRQLAMTHFLARKEVEHLETALIFEHLKKNTLPIYKKE